MPLYEYECLQCGGRFEVRRSFSDKAEDPKCPSCESEYTTRVFSPVMSCSGGSSGGSCSTGAPTHFG